MTARIYRVRYTEWQVFAMNVVAPSPCQAIALVEAIRHGRGNLHFEELDGGSDAWEAEALSEPLSTGDVRAKPARRSKGRAT
jgi:hypothetical protein